MSDGGQTLEIWTIYDHPKDYPHSFVARLFEGDKPTDEIMLCPAIEPLREVLAERGLTRLERSPEDDPVIMETWL